MADPAEQTPEQQSDALAGSGARTIAKRNLPRGTPTPEGLETPPSIADVAGYEALEPGKKFTDPEGHVRTKVWKIAGEDDYESVPEGQQYLDPEGNLRTKPAYQDVDFTAHTLYNMAANDKERRKALERSYPGKVKQAPSGECYVVEDDGTRRKPRKIMDPNAGWKSAGALAASAGAPTAGAIAGEIGGGLGGAALAPGIGALPGAVAGGGLGSAVGQGFNDMILQLAGVYDRSVGEEAGELATAGAFGAAGSAVGRGAAAVVGASGGMKELIKGGGGAKAANYFLGTDPEGLQTALGLADKGVAVPPSGYAKEAPHIQNVVEVFDPAFRTQKPLLQAATAHYEKTGGQILKDLGVEDAGSLTKPAEAVSTQKAGETVLRKTLAESQAADAKLREALAARQSGLPTAVAQRETLQQAAEQSRQAAQRLIDAGYADIRRTTDDAFRVAGAGHNSGDLWAGVGERLQAVKRGFQERATVMYDQADELAEGHLPNTEGLPELAERFASELPEEFQRNQPGIVRQLRALAGERDPETGEIIREPTQPTFGQLHNMRSQFRTNADWYRLNSDIKNGTYKFFANRVNEVLHDPHAVPELQDAARQLDRADAFYRENMPIFEANQIKAIMKGLEAGEPADPKNLFNAVVKEGHTDLTNRIRRMVGPNLWRGVQAADLDQMFTASRGLEPGQIDGRKFVQEVLERHRSGVLESVHDQEVSQRLLSQARAIQQLDGRLPIVARPGDTLTDVIARARTAAEAAQVAAKRDPLKTLSSEMKQIEREHARKAASGRRKDPLGFLYNPTTGADEAVKRVLGSEDLILAAAARFGESSPEFNMLRQVYVQRMLQDTMEPSAKLAKMSPEVQNIMFPGTTMEQMKLLAKEMDFLMGTRGVKDTAKSMAAQSKIENPWASIGGRGGTVSKVLTAPLKVFPGDAAGRAILTKYYALWQKATSSPAFLRWLEKGLKGDATAREMVKEKMQRLMQKGGAAGAGAGEAAFQGGEPSPQPELETTQ